MEDLTVQQRASCMRGTPIATCRPFWREVYLFPFCSLGTAAAVYAAGPEAESVCALHKLVSLHCAARAFSIRRRPLRGH